MTRVSRRALFSAPLWAAALRWAPPASAFRSTPYRVKFRKPAPHEAYRKYIMPGEDEFTGEREAMEIEARLARFDVVPAPDFEGGSPLPREYTKAAGNGPVTVRDAVYDPSAREFTAGFQAWRQSLGKIRRAQFYALPGGRVRYEIASSEPFAYRVGEWHMEWQDGKLRRFRPLSESLATAPKPLFSDITGNVLSGQIHFEAQLMRGIPYWRARLDSATGIDIYGSNGIAAGDIDNDGWDEIYVCQPGGLVNRLYKRSPQGLLEDITYQSGLDVLDDTSCALFADFRNTGTQDAVVLCSNGPLYFVNDGKGKFTHRPDAFQFATAPQGTFTGMAAADYDGDGRLDLYLCTYVYFQSEDRYRYPVPYHDAQNGPPNYLFRNTADGVFQDVTAATGINENNNRYSFAPAWCDFDGSGWPSLYVANDFGRKNLYKNTAGKFHDVARQAGVEDIGPGMSAAWFDADNDGQPDLYVANMWTASGQRVSAWPAFAPVRDGKMTEEYRRHSKGNSFYRNRGDGTFDEPAAGLEMGRWAWCADGVDFDNDGTPEVFVTAGMLTNSNPADLMSFFWRQTVARSPVTYTPTPAYENGWNALNQFIREEYSWNGNEPNVFFVRDGARYRDVSGVSGLDFAADSRAFAATDIDGDGNLDVILKSRLGPQVRVLRNECGVGRKALVVSLRGTKSNRDAIGARVDAMLKGGGRVTRWLNAGSGYLSQHTKRLHFGLGEAAAAEKVVVRWPSGAVQEFAGLEAGYRYTLTEGSSETPREPLRPRTAVAPVPTPQGDNAPRIHETWLSEPLPLPIPRRKAGFLLLGGEDDRRRLTPPDVPFETLFLAEAKPDDAAALALFRRYLLDWRADLETPFVMLTDAEGRVHRIYPDIPDADTRRRDLQALGTSAEHPIPFQGRYFNGRPARNYYRFGAAFVSAGYPDQALPYLREAVRIWPENWKAHLAIGQVHLEQGRPAEALPELELAARLNPRAPEVWNNLGGVAASQKKYAEALGYYEKALALNPDLSYVLSNAAQAQANLNRTGEAEALYRRALDVDAKDSDTADRFGLLLAQQGRFAEAQKLFQQAIANDQHNASAINNLGVLYKQTGKDNDALAAFLYGMEVAPEDENIAMNLARIYYNSGEREKARLVLERHLEKRPDSPRVKRALAELLK